MFISAMIYQLLIFYLNKLSILMTNHNILDNMSPSIFEEQTKMGQKLTRKLIMLLAASTLIVLPLATKAAQDDSSDLSVSTTKPAVSKTKHKVSSRKIFRTIRADNKYQVANYSLFHDDGSGILKLASSKALIVNQETGETLYAKSTDMPTPIASVTKLMTAMVMLDAHLPMDENIVISQADADMLKGTTSRLRMGTELTRAELLQLALMASENRAAAALGRNYPGGLGVFVATMNAKAQELGMTHTHFTDPTGLDSENMSTAEDLVKMVRAAYQYPEIRQVTTTPSYQVPVHGLRRPVNFVNTNILVRNSDWVIGLSKTGFISEAGRCLVMQAEIAGQPLIIVLLDSYGKYSRIGDAQRIRKWIESSNSKTRLG
jgi:serine-type D-Ala-D-Ala endopeptidase (penicillin-binding protein 7)